MRPPIMHLPIRVAPSGFYKGFTRDVTITAKLLVGALIRDPLRGPLSRP